MHWNSTKTTKFVIENFSLMINSIIILGSGNVAYHLVTAFLKADIEIKQIFSKNRNTGEQLAELANCNFTDNISGVFPDADAYIFAMNDQADKTVSQLLQTDKNKILVHTAGSLSMNIFETKTENYGVFYPFQTFSQSSEINFAKVPICLEASNTETLENLKKLTEKLSCKHYEINEEKRKLLHLTGVFACNFMNHCVYLGEEILKNADISKEIIKPLLEQSFDKILNQGAYSSQTGPALRNDKISMEKHLDFLQKDEKLSDIYRLLSESIFKTHNK